MMNKRGSTSSFEELIGLILLLVVVGSAFLFLRGCTFSSSADPGSVKNLQNLEQDILDLTKKPKGEVVLVPYQISEKLSLAPCEPQVSLCLYSNGGLGAPQPRKLELINLAQYKINEVVISGVGKISGDARACGKKNTLCNLHMHLEEQAGRGVTLVLEDVS